MYDYIYMDSIQQTQNMSADGRPAVDVRQEANHQDIKDTKEGNDGSGERLNEKHRLPFRAVLGALGVLGGGR